MDTILITRPGELTEAVKVLRKGGLVAVPTETVYGLCADGLNEQAVADLYEVKGRPEVKPLSLMVAGSDDMEKYARDIPPAAYTLAELYWPGPLTIVLKARDLVPSIVRAGGATVGLRCPDHPLTLALLCVAGLPLAGPSANPSGQPSPRTAETVLGYFDGKIDAVIDGGACGIGRESTIIDLSAAPYRILREGALSREEIGDVLFNSVKLIGLTGGTGTGKTTVLQALEARGMLGLDCDEIYHELLENCEPMLSEIRSLFPSAFAGDVLDRKALGRIVFSDPEALQTLNAVSHRYVKLEVRRRVEEYAWRGGRTAVIDAVALIESGLGDWCAMTVGVIAPKEVRLARIMVREGIGEEYARSRIAAQHEDAWYREHCGAVIENGGTLEELNEKLSALFA